MKLNGDTLGMIIYPAIFFVMIIILFIILPITAKAEDMTIDMLNKRDDGARMVYSEDIARIDVGDTITFAPKTKGHNVHFLAGPDGWDIPKKSKQNKEVVLTFDIPGVYLYQCTPHASMGMIGFVVVGEDTSNLDAIKKAKVRGKSKKIFKKLIKEL